MLDSSLTTTVERQYDFIVVGGEQFACAILVPIHCPLLTLFALNSRSSWLHRGNKTGGICQTAKSPSARCRRPQCRKESASRWGPVAYIHGKPEHELGLQD